MIRKKDIEKIAQALQDLRGSVEVTAADIMLTSSAKRTKIQQAFTWATVDIGKVLADHNGKFDPDRFLRAVMKDNAL